MKSISWWDSTGRLRSILGSGTVVAGAATRTVADDALCSFGKAAFRILAFVKDAYMPNLEIRVSFAPLPTFAGKTRTNCCGGTLA